METKPFQIQAPEDIAKEYGGDKQKIAQAMQMGVIDPTAGVLAGMFIDRIRSAQMQEMAPQPTVAQQVMGGASLAPVPQPPMAPQAGLGALPAPGMEGVVPPPAPQAPPEGAPMGMAGGGLADLPVPDGMFDEPENGGYGGGGLVAFADGGPLGPWFEEQAAKAVPGIGVAGRARTPERNREVGGVSGSFHIGDNARDFAPPPGMSLTELGDRLKRLYGPGYDVIYNTKGHYDHVHVEPGPELGRRVRAGKRGWWESAPASGGSQGASGLGAISGSLDTPQGRRRSFMEQMQLGREVYGALPDAGLNVEEEYYRRELEPEALRKRTKEDMWFTLAQIGASMAGTKSPNFLQAVGESLAAALPGAAASKKERRTAERDARQGLREVLGLKRAQEEKVIAFASAQQAAEMQAETNRLERDMRVGIAGAELASRERIAAASDATTRAVAAVRGANPSDFDTKFAILKRGNPGLSDAQILNLMKTEGYLGSSQGVIPGMEGAAGSAPGAAGASNMAIVGSRPAQ